jgi:L-cysteine S-thiosulfotransferase
MTPARHCAPAIVAALLASAAAVAQAQALAVVGDGVPQPLAAEAGDAVRGRALLLARDSANCVLCHALPDPAVRFSGNVGPALAGIGARLTPAQMRLRIADSSRLDPDTVMPSYYRVDGLDRVAAQYRGRPVLTAREVEDVVAYLGTLR